MKFPRLFGRPSTAPFCLLVLLLLSTTSPARAYGDDWKPVDPSLLALKTPVVEKDADAEAIFWDVRVDDASQYELVLTHYIRIKVFTERGREAQSRVDIPFLNKVKVRDVAGRTIKADGTIVELKKEDVYERTIVKASGLKLKAKSFAMPGVEPGAVIEYRWQEVRSNGNANYTRLIFQRDIPIQSVTYHVKPFGYSQYGMRVNYFHMPAVALKKESGGFYNLTATNVPAFHEEPNMPPENQVRQWALIYYSQERKLSPEKYWKDFGVLVHGIFKSDMKVNDEVRKAAAEAIGDASTPEQKLERLYNFCRTKIKNASDDASGMTAAEREKLKANKSPAETLRRGVGDGKDIDMLFASMASAAGFDARVALTADRSDIFFDPTFTDPYFLNPSSVAIRVGEQWRFFNPGFNYIPEGMLRWQEEGTQTLIADPKDPLFITTPVSEPEKSQIKRSAHLRLADDGTLEGDVKIEYTGHAGIAMKESNDDDSPAEREDSLKKGLKARLSTAEISDIHIDNVTDPVKPFTYAYHVRVPGYAQRTGKRLFLQPAFFQRNVGELFPTSERKTDIYFHYPWSEHDDVQIALPDGFTLDKADAPGDFGAKDLSQYVVKLLVSKDRHTLVYNRDFYFGSGGKILFPAGGYSQVKIYFDELHKRDNHTVVLKQETATATNSTPAN